MINTEDHIKELKTAKFECQESLLSHTRYFFKKRFNRKFVIGEHHAQIASLLDRVIKGEITKVIINIAPRYGKTELAVKNFISHGLAINPSARFIHLSYSDDLALDNSDEVREMVKSEDYQALFPNVKIRPNSDSKKKWYTTASGGVYATSAAGQVTGFGAGIVDDPDLELDFIENNKELFGGALIIDDPIKPEDADSEIARERINQRFDSTIRNRVNSRKTPIIIIMQRLHEHDLCGYLLEQEPGEWEVLSLPSIKADGTALWPFKHTVEELEKIKDQNELVFERQHMQDPKPLKGLLFPKNELRYFKPDPLLKFETAIGYVDVADEGKDYLSAPIGRNIGKDIYIPEVVFNKANTDVTLPLVANFLAFNKVVYVRVESNSMGAMFGRNLQKKLIEDESSECKVYNATSTTNKHTRILMDAEFIKKYCLFVHEDYQTLEYKAFMKQLCSYMKEVIVPHDDAADSMSGLVIFIRGILKHLYI